MKNMMSLWRCVCVFLAKKKNQNTMKRIAKIKNSQRKENENLRLCAKSGDASQRSFIALEDVESWS